MTCKISGKVVRGMGYGTKLGFPTANLAVEDFDTINLLKSGIYAGYATHEGVKYKAGIIIGPKGKDDLPKIEAHFLDYGGGDTYGNNVELELKKFLRGYKEYKNEEDLIAQIKRDLEVVRKT